MTPQDNALATPPTVRSGRPDFFVFLSTQCLMAEEILDLLRHYMDSPNKALAKEIEVLGDKGRTYHDETHRILNNMFMTAPLDREDVYRASDTLARLSRRAVTVALEMESLGLGGDSYKRQMSMALLEGCRSLREGYALLKDRPAEADPLARLAVKTKKNVERIYREGLNALFNVEAQLKLMREQSSTAEVSAMSKVIDVFKRREVYMNMNTAGQEVTQAAHILHDIIIQIT